MRYRSKSFDFSIFETDYLLELAEQYTYAEMAQMLGCPRIQLRYHMRFRLGIVKDMGAKNLQHREKLSQSALKRYGYGNKKDMIATLQALAVELGRTPRKTDLEHRNNVPGRAAFTNRFGSWTQALVAAGFDPGARRQRSVALKKKRCVKSFKERNYKQITPKLRFAILERDEFRCVYCGRVPADGAILHVDHIIPRSKGGTTSFANLVTSCRQCNLGKNVHVLKVIPIRPHENLVATDDSPSEFDSQRGEMGDINNERRRDDGKR